MKRLLAGLLVIALAACSHLAPAVPYSSPDQIHSTSARLHPILCTARIIYSADKLEACMSETSLWQHLSQFQKIADAHPGSDGHPSRDTGTSGYKASVSYVAGLMRQAGYHVTIQTYHWETMEVNGTPQLGTAARSYSYERDWFVARGSASGSFTAHVQPPTGEGCSPSDFATFARGNIALIALSDCPPEAQIWNAQTAGAKAVVFYDPQGTAHPMRLSATAPIPVIGVAAPSVGSDLLQQFQSGKAPLARIDVRMQRVSGLDYNLIADSPYGDPNRLVAIDAHLDSIYGAGMLDNASGSTTILEIALNLAKTPTKNRLRYIWFGGEELGLLGSQYYTTHLSKTELQKLLFDVDVDVTATPNYDILVADPAYAWNVNQFPPNVVPESRVGNDFFADFFQTGGVVSRNAKFGNDGTDSNSFSLVGVPNSGILTDQDCCKRMWEKQLWGGFLGNYEGKIPSYDGGCVDYPHRWCDNLSNNDPFVLQLASKAVAYVTINLANDASLK